MRFRVLGPVGLSGDDGREIEVSSRSQRAVLAVLVAHSGELVGADTLIDALWAEGAPPTARPTLRSYISRLRRVVGQAVVSRGDGYLLTAGSSDAEAFDRLLDVARAAPSAEAVTLLDDALSLWRGPAFAEFADLEAVRGEARRLELRRRDARQARAEALLGVGRTEEAAAAAAALAADEPLREPAWALLVESLAATAPGEALRTHQRAVATLAEVGLQPSRQLRHAEQVALGLASARLVERRPGPPRSRTGPAGWLPSAPRTSFLGRERDLHALTELLTQERLVTIIGPGGVGKTRLAVEVARRSAGRHRDGARIARLAELGEPDAVAPAVVEALGLNLAHAVDDALARAGDLDAVLVVDNCEHVLDAAATTIEHVLDAGDGVRVIATSRQRLGLEGEWCWPLRPLPTDGDVAVAQQLFLERARAFRPDLEVAPDDLAAVDRIVRRLEGLPLALEMAAALIPTSTLVELAGVLDRDLDVLRAPTRSVARRHHTLRALLDWSERHLDDRQREVLTRLAVFDGPVSRHQLPAVLDDDDADALPALVERSLVAVDTVGPATRYRLLQPIRDHARRRLDAAAGAELRRRHLEHHLEIACTADCLLDSDREREGHQLLEEAYVELRAAHLWARDHSPARAVQLTRHLHVWSTTRQRADPFRWAQALVSEPDPSPAALAGRARALTDAGRPADAQATAERALRRAAGRDLPPLFEVLADLALFAGRLDEAEQLGRRLAAAALEQSHRHYEVVGRCTVALALGLAGRVRSAEEALAGVSVEGLAPTDQGWLHYTRAALGRGREPEVATAHLRQAIRLADGVHSTLLGSVARVSLASQQAEHGEPGEAGATLRETIEHLRLEAAVPYLTTTLRNLVLLLARLEQHQAAAELLSTLDTQTHSPTFGEEAERLAATADDLRRALGDDSFAAHRRAGAYRSLDEASRLAVAALNPALPEAERPKDV